MEDTVNFDNNEIDDESAADQIAALKERIKRLESFVNGFSVQGSELGGGENEWNFNTDAGL